MLITPMPKEKKKSRPYDFEWRIRWLLSEKRPADALELLIKTRQYLRAISHLVHDYDEMHTGQCHRVTHLFYEMAEMRLPEPVRFDFLSYCQREFIASVQKYHFKDMNWLLIAAKLVTNKRESDAIHALLAPCEGSAWQEDIDEVRRSLASCTSVSDSAT